MLDPQSVYWNWALEPPVALPRAWHPLPRLGHPRGQPVSHGKNLLERRTRRRRGADRRWWRRNSPWLSTKRPRCVHVIHRRISSHHHKPHEQARPCIRWCPIPPRGSSKRHRRFSRSWLPFPCQQAPPLWSPPPMANNSPCKCLRECSPELPFRCLFLPMCSCIRSRRRRTPFLWAPQSCITLQLPNSKSLHGQRPPLHQRCRGSGMHGVHKKATPLTACIVLHHSLRAIAHASVRSSPRVLFNFPKS